MALLTEIKLLRRDIGVLCFYWRDMSPFSRTSQSACDGFVGQSQSASDDLSLNKVNPFFTLYFRN